MIIYLTCKVLDTHNKVVWKENINSKAVKGTAAGLLAGGGILVGGIFGTYLREKSLGALEDAGEESLI